METKVKEVKKYDSDRPLTKEQQQLVTDNHQLIYKFLAHKGLLKWADDWYGEIALGLMDAARKYDPSRDVPFSAFAWQGMTFKFKKASRKYRNRVEPETLILDAEVQSPSDNNTGMTYLDLLACENPQGGTLWDGDIEDTSLMKWAYSKALARLPEPHQQWMYDLIFVGKTGVEIAEEYNCSRAAVSLAFRKFVRQVRRYYNGGQVC
jgi:RNA polymerase sigma factor (sigma-70 family)